MKKHFTILLAAAAVLTLVLLAGCSKPPQPTDEEMKDAYAKATTASGWFTIAAMDTDYDEKATYNGDDSYTKVIQFETKKELTDYLEGLFSPDLAQSFLRDSDYVEIDGKLYTRDAARGADITKGEETYVITRHSDKKIVLSVSVEILDSGADFKVTGSEVYEFNYEYLDGKWVFTTFPKIR